MAQRNLPELLMEYEFYVEKNIEMGKWKTKYFLKNGLVISKETYWKNRLRSRSEFGYDNRENINQEIETYNINDGKVHKVTDIKNTYKDSVLIRRETDWGLVEQFSNFNKLGKPKIIERLDELGLWPYREIIEYDQNGNVIKSVKFSRDLNDKSQIEKTTVHYKYDERNNVIEIHREFEPKKVFPILTVGGPHKYEFEYFRYVYNDIGLWTKKYKTVNGKEYLIKKRKYK